MPEFADRYGMKDAPRTPAALNQLILEGMVEWKRVVRPGGYVLIKSATYVSSGRLYAGTFHIQVAAEALGLELVDQLHHYAVPRPQPVRTRKDGSPVRQLHARNNYSTLSIFKRRGRKSARVKTP
jgi:hypothetical protein